jgi:ATP-dependent DNA ligase
VPTGPGWAYEIKHDGFRFQCWRERKRVRVFSRGGHDWSAQLPASEAAMIDLTNEADELLTYLEGRELSEREACAVMASPSPR